jgi:hypothetical protein
VSAKEPTWQQEELPVEDVRERPDFQLRADGVQTRHVRVLERTLAAGGDLEPIKVARIGKALYVVDGFHRLEAARRQRLPTIRAAVARMSLEEAQGFALLANTKHGKSLRPKDKALILARYVELGKHVGANGVVKSSRAIAAEINHAYSHETVRTKLKGLGVELDEAVEYPWGYKPYGDDEADEAEEAELELERAAQARGALDRFAALALSLDEGERLELVGAARALLDSLERGERGEALSGAGADANPLDI